MFLRKPFPGRPDVWPHVDAASTSPSHVRYAVFAICAAIVALVAFLLVNQRLRVFAEWNERQASIVDDRARLVSNWLRERRLDAEANARAPEVISYLSRRPASSSPRDLLSHLALLDQTKDSYGYLGTYVLDRQGRVVTQAAGSRAPSPLLAAAALRAMAEGQARIEWFPEPARRVILAVLAPVPREFGSHAGQLIVHPLGAVAVVVDPYEKLFPLLTAESVPTHTGETMLVAPDGDRILLLSPMRGGSRGVVTLPRRSGLAAEAALQGWPLFGRFTDYRGVAVLAAVRRIPEIDLGLVSKIDSAEAFADYRREAWIEAGLAALSLLAIGGWFYGYRRYVWAGFLAARESEVRGLLESTPDGLVIVDAAGHVVLVNSQTEVLFGCPRPGLIGKPFSDLVPGVDPRSAAPACGIEANAIRHNGAAFPAELRFNLVAADAAGRVLVAIRDLTERKRMEGALRATEEQYAVLFDSSNDAALVFELTANPVDSPFIQANSMACQRLGYTHEELLQRSLRDIHTPEALRGLEPVGQRLAAGERCLFQTEHLARDGRLIPVEINARTIDLNGRRAVLAVARDITERQRATRELEASERRYRRYVERNAAGLLRSTLNGEILECNDALVRMLGYESQQELISRRLAEIYQTPADRQFLLRLLQELLVVNGYELCVRRKDGSLVWVVLNLTLVTGEGEPFVEATAIDISERKRMEKELQTIAALVEASSDFIGFASLEGEVRFINQAGRRFAGLDPGRPVDALAIRDFLPECDRHFLRDTIRPCVLRDGKWAGEVRLRNFTTGALIPMWQSVFYVTDRISGQRIALATICRDLTERKQEEDAIRAAQRAAEAGNLAKSRFLANMSHEIRTPMNGILGMTRLLLAGELSDEQRHYGEVVLASCETLLSLVNHILDLSKIEAGKVVLEKVDFDLAALLQSAAQPLALEAASKSLAFETVLDPALPVLLRGDPVRLRQIVANLAANALKFTSRGSIRVRVSFVSGDERGAVLRFEVSDTGIGIPPDKLAGLFSPFVQADESTTRKFGGTGLGLSIAKQLVELMGGRIGCTSEPDRGSRFWFTISLEKQPPPAVPAAATSPPAQPSAPSPEKLPAGKRQGWLILVVEDQPVNREVIVAMLRHFGCRSQAVNNGREAVAAVQSASYDLILMDCQMPEMDGYEATRLIRDPATRALNPRIPIVAVTAGAMTGDREKCVAAGMDDYLSKPIEPRGLSLMLDRWLAPSPAAATTAAASPVSPPHAAAPADTPPPVFDRDALLARLMGKQDLAEKVFRSFVESAPVQLENLRRCLAAQDASAACREAHGLKGAASTASAPALFGLARAAEHAAAAAEWARFEALLPDMESQVERLRAVLSS